MKKGEKKCSGSRPLWSLPQHCMASLVQWLISVKYICGHGFVSLRWVHVKKKWFWVRTQIFFGGCYLALFLSAGGCFASKLCPFFLTLCGINPFLIRASLFNLFRLIRRRNLCFVWDSVPIRVSPPLEKSFFRAEMRLSKPNLSFCSLSTLLAIALLSRFSVFLFLLIIICIYRTSTHSQIVADYDISRTRAIEICY